MKRLFVLFAFLMLSCTAFVQDLKAQSEGTLLVVPRVDLDPAYDGGWSFDFGSTSLYTLFEGNLTKNLSFSVCNHWFAFCTEFEDAASLYRNTWHAGEPNWCDWANLTYKIGNFFISAGKDYMRIGNFEIEDYDYDSHWQMNSFLWNNFQVYQWGGRLGWQSEDEDLTLSLQMTTDPIMYRFFETANPSNYAYTFNAFYEGETLSLLGSITHSASWGWIGAAGARIGLSDALTLGTDINLNPIAKAGSLSVTANLSEQLDMTAKLGYEWFGASDWDGLAYSGHLFGGVVCNWYPLRDSHDLRVHAMLAPTYLHSRVANISGSDSALYMSVGATYFFEFQLF